VGWWCLHNARLGRQNGYATKNINKHPMKLPNLHAFGPVAHFFTQQQIVQSISTNEIAELHHNTDINTSVAILLTILVTLHHKQTTKQKFTN